MRGLGPEFIILLVLMLCAIGAVVPWSGSPL
jgi:hypothetical protein